MKKKRKKRKKTKKFKKVNCAPRTKSNKLNYTCYTKKTLLQLKKMWNARHSDVPIKTKKPREIWKKIKKNFRSICDTESCWVRKNLFKQKLSSEILNRTFAPTVPNEWKKDPQTWLNSIDISNIMKQYEKEYPSFRFIGPSPIDYDAHEYNGECVWEELCKFNLYKLKRKGIRKIGIIFNLDPHDEEGSHWVCMFIHIPKKEIYYLDSYGEPICKQIMKFVLKVQDQTYRKKEKFLFIENKIRHQYSTTECGMYCLYMIINLLKNKTFKSLTLKRISDKKMIALRKKYFNYKMG